MKYKLGLDLGSTSLGWAAVELDDNDNIIGLLDLGVRIFPDGRDDQKKEISNAAKRSSAAQMRVQFDRKIERREKLLKILQGNGFLPKDEKELKYLLDPEKGNSGLTDPYYLRDKASREEVSLYELGRVFWHLSKHRGFSGKKDQDIDNHADRDAKNSKDTADATETEKEAKSVNARIDKLRGEILSADYKTLGQYLYARQQEGKKLSFKGLKKEDGSGDQSGFMDGFPSRQLYIEEFNYIWDMQKRFHSELTDELKTQLQDKVIYYQRPLKQKEPGKCKFTGRDRIAKCQPLYQEFRIWQDINNLKIGGGSLSEGQRDAVFNLLNDPAKFGDVADAADKVSFDLIYHVVSGRPDDAEFNPDRPRFNLEEGGRKGLLCNKTNLVMSKLLGAKWNPNADNYKVIEKLTAYYESRSETERFIRQDMGITDDSLMKKLLKLKLPKGYGELSGEAIGKILPLIRQGKRYDEAAAEIFGSHSALRPYLVGGYNPPAQLPPYQILFPESLTNGKIGNVTVHIGLNQIRLIVNELIKKYNGHPSEINIEMARDLKMGQKAYAEYRRKQSQNEDMNMRARLAIKEAKGDADYEPTATDMEKYRVWFNLNPFDAKKRYDYYNDSEMPTIPLVAALTSEYEIDHIIPRALGGDDTWCNKILTKAVSNRAKGDRTPAQYLSERQLARAKFWAEELDKINEARRSKKTKYDASAKKAKKKDKEKEFKFFSLAWRFEPGAEEKCQNRGFKSRDLNDTRYMSKLARDYLSYICSGFTRGAEKGHRTPKVLASNGALTDLFKSVWGVNETLPMDYMYWNIQKWQRDLMAEKIKEKLMAGPDSDKYNMASKGKDESKAAKKLLNDDVESELAKLSDNDFYKISSRKKDRSNHYHHALDAFVIACMNNSMANDINSMANEIELENRRYNLAHDDEAEKETLNQTRKRLIKNNGKFKIPFDGFDMGKLKAKMKNIIISEKQSPDKLKQALESENKPTETFPNGRSLEQISFSGVTKDTAFGLADTFLNNKRELQLKLKHFDGKKNKIEVSSFDSMVPVFNKKHLEYRNLKARYISAYAEYKKNPKNEDNIKTLCESIAKDKVFKWLASEGNYAAEIYETGKNGREKWNVEVMSNWWALQRRGRFFWCDSEPSSKFIMRLRIGDIVRATFKKGDKSILPNMKEWVESQIGDNEDADILFRVKKASGYNVYLTPIHVAQQDGDTKAWQASATTLKAANVRKVTISPLGELK